MGGVRWQGGRDFMSATKRIIGLTMLTGNRSRWQTQQPPNCPLHLQRPSCLNSAELTATRSSSQPLSLLVRPGLCR